MRDEHTVIMFRLVGKMYNSLKELFGLSLSVVYIFSILDSLFSPKLWYNYTK